MRVERGGGGVLEGERGWWGSVRGRYRDGGGLEGDKAAGRVRGREDDGGVLAQERMVGE